jgi:hypothetical protein
MNMGGNIYMYDFGSPFGIVVSPTYACGRWWHGLLNILRLEAHKIHLVAWTVSGKAHTEQSGITDDYFQVI